MGEKPFRSSMTWCARRLEQATREVSAKIADQKLTSGTCSLRLAHCPAIIGTIARRRASRLDAH